MPETLSLPKRFEEFTGAKKLMPMKLNAPTTSLIRIIKG